MIKLERTEKIYGACDLPVVDLNLNICKIASSEINLKERLTSRNARSYCDHCILYSNEKSQVLKQNLLDSKYSKVNHFASYSKESVCILQVI